MSALQLSNITKYFDNALVIDRVNFDVKEGEFVSLLGPSGCGKTTILRMISGLEAPTTGHIMFNGQDVTQTPIAKRHVGMVFQQFALFPHMTVEKNVSFGLRMAGLDSKTIALKTAEMLDVVQLQAERRRYPSQISGGQQQRVALARTLITEPGVLLMDEPFSSLDTGLRLEMQQFIADLQKRLGITTILVTHDQQEAMALSERIALMFQGKIAQYASPEQLYNQPDTAAIAQFMGPTNLITAQGVTPTSSRCNLDDQILLTHGAVPIGPIMFSIRPEQVTILSGADNGKQMTNCFRGQLVSKNFRGAFSELTIAVGGTTLTALSAVQAPHRLGDMIQLQLPEAHLFPISESIG